MKRLRVLRVLLSITETSAPYNQFSLTLAQKQDITICTYFQTKIRVSKKIRIFEGNNTIFGFYRVLRAALNSNEYDVCHAHTPHVGFLLILAIIFSNPKAVSSTVYTVHSSYPNYKFRNRVMLVWVFIFYRRIITCSHASYNSFPSLFKRLAGHRLQVIQNGVDIKRIDQGIQGIQVLDKSQDFTIVTVGRLIDLKQPHVLLEAFHRIRETQKRLIFIGQGDLHKALIAQSRQLGIRKKVLFTGLIPRDDVFQYLGNADLYVSTSRIEGFPVAVLEAMACRSPVILSDIPPHRELANTGKCIQLVSNLDVDELTSEIERFMQMSKNELEIIGQNNRQIAEGEFSLKKMHKEYNQLFEELLVGEIIK